MWYDVYTRRVKTIFFLNFEHKYIVGIYIKVWLIGWVFLSLYSKSSNIAQPQLNPHSTVNKCQIEAKTPKCGGAPIKFLFDTEIFLHPVEYNTLFGYHFPSWYLCYLMQWQTFAYKGLFIYSNTIHKKLVTEKVAKWEKCDLMTIGSWLRFSLILKYIFLLICPRKPMDQWLFGHTFSCDPSKE